MLGYDANSDRHLTNRDPHYRLYLGKDGPTVICVQDFDYIDYDQGRFLGNKAWPTEEAANEGLRLLVADALAVTGRIALP